MKKSHRLWSTLFTLVLLVGMVMLSVQWTPVRQTAGTADATYEYELAWEENFSGSRLDTTKWSVIPRKPWQPFWWMSSHKSLYKLKGGKLRLYCRRNTFAPKDTAAFLCGGVWTKNKFTVKYGKIEVRAKVVGVQGSWPAIWTLVNDQKTNNYGTPTYAEVDLMESINREKTSHQTIHNYYVDILKKLPHAQYHVEVPIDYQGYNTYTAEILPDKVIMSVNGKTTLVYPRTEGLKGQFPYGVEQMIILDMQFGGTTWVGKADMSQLPAYMDVDWVKVYRLKGY